jgi:hypothetical protein
MREQKIIPDNESKKLSHPSAKVAVLPRWLLLAGGALLALALVLSALYLFWKLANPPIGPISPGDPVFVRDIYIILDATASMSESDINEAKEIIKSRIFPDLGPGDRVFCYGIGAGFDERRDRIFGQKALPGAPVNLLDAKRANRVPADAVSKVWQEAPSVLQDWSQRLDSLRTGEEYLKLSGYFDAFNYISERIKGPKDPQLQERRLIVFGDLYQDPVPDPFQPPAPGPEEINAFSGLKVRLIYPYKAGQRLPIQPAALQQFWQQYFSQRGNDKALITTFDDPAPLLDPSPVPTPPMLK